MYATFSGRIYSFILVQLPRLPTAPAPTILIALSNGGGLGVNRGRRVRSVPIRTKEKEKGSVNESFIRGGMHKVCRWEHRSELEH